MWEAVFEAVFANDTDRFEQGPGGVGELDPVDGEVDVRSEAGGVIPDFEEVGGDLEAEGIEEDFQVGIEVGGGFGCLAKKMLESLLENVVGEEIFISVDGAF